ncbi:hypothetical protein HYQ46_011663 [Verticillium longisporum]|nr:hypothetical protein HYQ46_011663 [Verticillium longisporum]
MTRWASDTTLTTPGALAQAPKGRITRDDTRIDTSTSLGVKHGWWYWSEAHDCDDDSRRRRSSGCHTSFYCVHHSSGQELPKASSATICGSNPVDGAHIFHRFVDKHDLVEGRAVC